MTPDELPGLDAALRVLADAPDAPLNPGPGRLPWLTIGLVAVVVVGGYCLLALWNGGRGLQRGVYPWPPSEPPAQPDAQADGGIDGAY
jgi:hypothetical protein